MNETRDTTCWEGALRGCPEQSPRNFWNMTFLDRLKWVFQPLFFFFTNAFRFNLMTFYTNKLLWVCFFGELWYANWLNDNLNQFYLAANDYFDHCYYNYTIFRFWYSIWKWYFSPLKSFGWCVYFNCKDDSSRFLSCR